tara:strand:- start:92 stop:196 length:105 start_codon:yes stop_codon:yes gene_type:complete
MSMDLSNDWKIALLAWLGVAVLAAGYLLTTVILG